MRFDDDEFFEANTVNINRLISKILILLNLLPPVFVLLNKIHVFTIENIFSLKAAVCIGTFTITDAILVFGCGSERMKSKKLRLYDSIQHFAKYFGLFGSAVILGVLGTHTHIGIYISYALVTFMSCLYYSKRTALLMSVSCYVIMLCSLYGKSVARVAEHLTSRTARNDFLSYAAGFTVEFLFVFIITYSITKRSKKTLDQAMEKNEQLRKTQFEIMEFIPKILESHEVFTGHHVKHTVQYVDLIAREMKKKGFYVDILTEDTIVTYSAAANLHDIGKVHIPDNILNKPGKYTPEEFEMMKSHPEEGKKLIESLPKIKDGTFNEIALQMAYYHHEKYDGSGYPNGISGKDIPLCARIMAAADVLDALLSWRPYKEPFDIDTVIGIFEDCRGKHFEPCIVDAVVDLKPLILLLAEDFKIKETSDEEKEYKWRQRIAEGQKKKS